MAKSDSIKQALAEASRNLESDPSKSWRARIDIPQTDDELHHWVKTYLNIDIPRRSCCEEHTPPFDAFAEAYFARVPRSVWVASRLTGKTLLLATLSLTESITLGASVTLLGGSGEQSQRVHEYLGGENNNLPHSFWGAPDAPVWMWDDSNSTKKRTKLVNGGSITALMASATSVRGPHPQRMRGDEIDEMDQDLWDAASGQAMPNKGIQDQQVGSSTWHHPDGTMAEELRRARRNGWSTASWCVYCCHEDLGGFLTEDFLQRKKVSVPKHVWEVEFELGRPSPEGRFLVTDAMEFTFDKELGEVEGILNQDYIFEEPVEGAEYATGADWAKSRDRTIIVTLRTDVDPMRVVQYAHMGHISFPRMVEVFNETVRKYDSYACHDATGLGAVLHDYIEVSSEGVVLQGRRRSHIFSEYIKALEQHEIKSPDIEYMKEEHSYAVTTDLYGTGHPPDSIVAMALAYRASETLDILY